MDNVDNVDILSLPEEKIKNDHEIRRIKRGLADKKISTYFKRVFTLKYVDNVDNYFFRRFSPMFITSPAPIVINKSPGAQLFKINFSISSKLGK